jgi:hypothetical protein
MTGAEASRVHDSRADQSVDINSLIESLRLAGAGHFDAVRLHYLQVLAQRAVGHPAPVKRLLDAKLAHALAAYKDRFERAQGETRDAVARIVRNHPDAAADLQRLLQGGDFKAVRQRMATLNNSANRVSLGDLTRRLAQRSLSDVDAGSDSGTGPGSELQTTQFFRDTWSKLSVGKRVTQELDNAPKNAGPINSHMLVLRSLATMRDISPDYLSRFTSYVDTLLSLDQCNKEKQVLIKKAASSESGQKPKNRRTKAL